ncbi:MAG: biotin--[acetyl-CoA-carboxylase] ligase [Ignavibacteriales bacterium]|nr:biotin--[acetyl-CoA-carboxylase] ligase [Ignavibacteriales bacterium]MCF8305016.1 biotin--[acetyl-CoA-carboxylase] ligase [Ignavibacteriales bacterium]MCF8314705.1 biotin--[acetyl-CoA-carboxylase] ligase [Ignavibacteriales bacterium]MCF8438047.1 biotin--[acetyl-CoA-carboxylase] ligase [Ignavibacteriales bacterium]
MSDINFNLEEFNLQLDTHFIGTNIYFLDHVESTNSYLMSRNEDFENGTVVIAETQTKGRGRLDRTWLSDPKVNLTFSIALTKKDLFTSPAMINFAASLAVANALQNLFQLPVELKWPNDVLVKGKKISGILMESISAGSEITRMVVGFGINVNQSNFPGKYLILPTSVKNEYRGPISRERILSEVLNLFEQYLGFLKFDKKMLLQSWKEKCRMIGEKVKIESGDTQRFGVFVDVDVDGFLLFREGAQTSKITFGDVSLRGQ